VVILSEAKDLLFPTSIPVLFAIKKQILRFAQDCSIGDFVAYAAKKTLPKLFSVRILRTVVGWHSSCAAHDEMHATHFFSKASRLRWW
jgi:hypothetical protein